MLTSTPSQGSRRKLRQAGGFKGAKALLLCALLTLASALTADAQATGAGDKAAAQKDLQAFVERPAGANKPYRLAFPYYTLREPTAATLTLNNKGLTR